MFEVWEMYWDSAGQLPTPIPCLQFQDFIPSILLWCFTKRIVQILLQLTG